MEYDTIFAAARRAGNELALVDAGRLSRTVVKAAALLRENCHILGLSPDFKIVDDERAEAMKTAALEQVLEARYARPEDYPGFLALADTVGGAATFAAYRRGCVTVNYSMNFLRPAWGSTRRIRCRAQAVKLGRTLSVFGMSLTDDEGMEVASGNFTFYITGWMKSEEEKEPGAI